MQCETRVQLLLGKAVQARRPLGDQLLAEREVADQRARVAQRDVGAELELARLADVVQHRRADQQVGVEPRVQHARLLRERGDRDRVLEQPAEVRVVAAARAGRAAQLGAERLVAEERVEQRAQVGVVDLAREVLEEAVELLDVAVGDRQEVGRVRLAVGGAAISRSSTCSSSRKRSTRPRTRTRSPRSNWAARKSASRNARAGIAPLRSRSSTARYGAPLLAVSRSLRVQANTPVDLAAGAQLGDADALVGGDGHGPIVTVHPDAAGARRVPSNRCRT